jgi:glycosyltransferase involved in cell wall biosynthesis
MVVDALTVLGGAERALLAALQVFPEAPIYSLVYDRRAFTGTRIAQQKIYTSFINRLPGSHINYRYYLPLLPLAIEQFDLRSFDIILSFSYAVAHGVLARPGQLHVSYTHTPMRQAWHGYHDFLDSAGWKGWLARPVLHALRMWDFAAAARVDHFLAASRWIASAIQRAYRRAAQVLYPPVDTDVFQPMPARQDFFVIVSRLEQHKRVDIAIEAFSELGYPLLVVGAGQQARRLARRAAGNVKMLGWLPDAQVRQLVGQARAFILPGEEDFNIAAVEAQAAGCPVIAFASGGACETIREGVSGIFFHQQTPQALIEAVGKFEQNASSFDAERIRGHASQFSNAAFQERLSQIIAEQWQKFRV